MVVSVPEVARVAIVAVEPRLTVLIALHVEHVEVAIRVGNCTKYHLCHRPLNTRGIESCLRP